MLSHEWQVHKIAREVGARLPRHLEMRELEQQGRLGLVQAAARYDPGSGHTFAAFAYWRIRGAIIDANRRSAYWQETSESLEAIQEAQVLRHGGRPADRVADPAPRVDVLMALAEARERMMATLEAGLVALPSDEQSILRAALAGAAAEEIASEQGVSVACVRKRLQAAREKAAETMRAAAPQLRLPAGDRWYRRVPVPVRATVAR